jgi:hypothetical protein
MILNIHLIEYFSLALDLCIHLKKCLRKKGERNMSKTFSRSDFSVRKTLAPPFSTVVGVDSDDFGYEASYDSYSAVGDTKDDAIDNLADKLQDKGYEEE